MNYQRIYDQIIEKARKEARIKGTDIYYEAHHIVPKCIGGDGHESQWRFHPNIVLLTAKEHFICHRLLIKIYPESRSLRYAFRAMCILESGNQGRVKPSSQAYIEARQGLKPSMESIQKGIQTKKLNPTFRSKEATMRAIETKKKNGTLYRTPEQKINMSNSQKGKRLSKEHRKKISQTLKNRKVSEETRLKISKGLGGKLKSEEHRKNLSESKKSRKKVGILK